MSENTRHIQFNQETKDSIRQVEENIEKINQLQEEAGKELAQLEEGLACKGPSQASQAVKYIRKAALIGAIIDAGVTFGISLGKI